MSRVGLPKSEYFTCPSCKWKLIPAPVGATPTFLCRRCELLARQTERRQLEAIYDEETA
jgi:predicted RNA-binding Zn-ribbon protein involved in translation (DUF1610 family)